MKTIAFFNNKGGVGKTTLLCNIAAYYSHFARKNVLVIDCDPQCNATQLILGDTRIQEIFLDKTGGSSVTTVVDIVRPMQDGDSGISDTIKPITSDSNRFQVSVIPGHPQFSMIEDRLSQAWYEKNAGEIGGYRKINWMSYLLQKVNNDYDLCFIDLGPSLGSINRTVLLGCDFFLTPMGCDIFSIIGIKNLAIWLKQWISEYKSILPQCEAKYPGKISQYNIVTTPKIERGYIGYTLQQYITKSKHGIRRPTTAFENILESIPQEISSSLSDLSIHGSTLDTLKLGDIPQLYSLVPLAQSGNTPIFKLNSSDNLVGSQYKQAKDYAALLNAVADSIYTNITPEA